MIFKIIFKIVFPMKFEISDRLIFKMSEGL